MGIKKSHQKDFFDYNNTRICNQHKMIKREKIMSVERLVRNKMVNQKIKFTYDVPAPQGMKSTLSLNSQELTRKTTAKQNRYIREWNEGGENDNFKDLASSYQQVLENQTPSKCHATDDGGHEPFLSVLGVKLGPDKERRGFGRSCLKYNVLQKQKCHNPHPTVLPRTLSK